MKQNNKKRKHKEIYFTEMFENKTNNKLQQERQ